MAFDTSAITVSAGAHLTITFINNDNFFRCDVHPNTMTGQFIVQ